MAAVKTFCRGCATESYSEGEDAALFKWVQGNER